MIEPRLPSQNACSYILEIYQIQKNQNTLKTKCLSPTGIFGAGCISTPCKAGISALSSFSICKISTCDIWQREIAGTFDKTLPINWTKVYSTHLSKGLLPVCNNEVDCTVKMYIYIYVKKLMFIHIYIFMNKYLYYMCGYVILSFQHH